MQGGYLLGDPTAPNKIAPQAFSLGQALVEIYASGIEYVSELQAKYTN